MKLFEKAGVSQSNFETLCVVEALGKQLQGQVICGQRVRKGNDFENSSTAKSKGPASSYPASKVSQNKQQTSLLGHLGYLGPCHHLFNSLTVTDLLGSASDVPMGCRTVQHLLTFARNIKTTISRDENLETPSITTKPAHTEGAEGLM